MDEIDVIDIPKIELHWSDWYKWDEIKTDSRLKSNNKIIIPNKKSGVYEARYENSEERLTIGKASDLRMRVRQGLVKGKVPHSTGNRMREEILDFSKVFVRWAITIRPSATEEELHRRHIEKFGSLPRYVMRT